MASAGVPIRSPLETAGGRGSNGTALRLTVIPTAASRSSACLPSSSDSRRSTQHQVHVGAAGQHVDAAAGAAAARPRPPWRRRGSAPGARGTARTPAIRSATALPAMTCSSGPPCWPGNTAELIFFASSSVQRIIPPRPPPIVLWIVVVTTSAYGTGLGCSSGRHEPREVGHVDHQVGADGVGDRAEALEVEEPRVRRPAGEDHLRPALLREPLDLVHVDQARLAVDVVGGDLVEPPGEVDLHPVRQMAAVGELEPHHRVARRHQRLVRGGVGLRAGVRLDVRVLGPEQLLGAVDRQLLGDVDELAAAVVALAGIALGVLVRQHRPLALEHRHRHEVLRGDHLERPLLALELPREHLGDLRIDFGERPVEEVGRQLGAHAGDDISGGGRVLEPAQLTGVAARDR